MHKKLLLYIGIFLLVLGILFRVVGFNTYISMPLIVSGALFKIFYLHQRILKGGYKPGIEMFFLVLGLVLFLSAIYLKIIAQYINPLFLMVPGLFFKLLFVALFIRKLKK